MTNKEAIECLKCNFYNMESCDKEECNEHEAITMAIEALEDIEKLSKSKEWLKMIAKEISYEKLGDYSNDRYDRGFNAAIDMCASIILEAIIGSEEE